MTKQVIIFTWGNNKRLGYSKIEGETEWTMDMPESPRAVSKILKLTASDERIEKMAKDTEAESGKVYNFKIDENEDSGICFERIKKGMNKMTRMVKDGWHEIAGYTVFVENGEIVRGMTSDKQRTTWCYRYNRSGGWDKEDSITVDAFRAGVRRGTIKMA